MDIDWFTFGAQIANLFILAFLLHRFVYRPVRGAMEERDDTIQQRFDEAERKREEAEELREKYQSERAKIEEEREELITEAEEEAEERREELLDEIRSETDEMQRRWLESLESRREEFLAELVDTAREQIIAISKKSLEDLADVPLEEVLVDRFCDYLGELEGDRLDTFRRTAREAGEVVVATALPLDDEAKTRLHDAVTEIVDVDVSFERDANLLLGARVSTEGREIAWNVSDYLDELRKRVAEVVDERIEILREAADGTE